MAVIIAKLAEAQTKNRLARTVSSEEHYTGECLIRSETSLVVRGLNIEKTVNALTSGKCVSMD